MIAVLPMIPNALMLHFLATETDCDLTISTQLQEIEQAEIGRTEID